MTVCCKYSTNRHNGNIELRQVPRQNNIWIGDGHTKPTQRHWTKWTCWLECSNSVRNNIVAYVQCWGRRWVWCVPACVYSDV